MNPTIANYAPAQLLRAIERAEAIRSDICTEMILAGRGHERPSETRAKTDELSMRANNISQTLGELYAEKERRMTWHGSLKRVKEVVA